jgi:membrane-bound ClpP family serine protease
MADAALRSYLTAQLPGWLAGGLAAWALVRWFEVAPATAAIVAALWILKDLLLFPFMRRFYLPQPPERRIVGEVGVTVTALEPEGFVQVRGELWQARLADGGLPPGSAVRVADIRGLVLLVAPCTRRDGR